PTAAMLRPIEGAVQADQKLQATVNRFFQGRDKAAKAGAKKVSEEERALERLNDRYTSLMATADERIALFGQEGEAAAIRYATEHGELVKLTEAQKSELITRYER